MSECICGRWGGMEEGGVGGGLGTWQSLGISGSLRPGKRSIFNCYC